MKILIEMRGGLIDLIYSDEAPGIILLDWDEVSEAEAGIPMACPVSKFPVMSMEDIPTDTMEVIKKYTRREEQIEWNNVGTEEVKMRYEVVGYLRIDPDEHQIFDTVQEAAKEQEHLDGMIIDGENLYIIREVDGIND